MGQAWRIGVDPNGVVRGKVANPAYDNLTLLSRLLVAGAEEGSARVVADPGD